MGRIRTLVLHVGLHHTGADLLAQSLVLLRPQLHRNGVALLTTDELAGLAHADGWALEQGSPPDHAPLFDGELRVLAGAEVDSAARSGATARTLLITGEQLTGGRIPGRGDRDSFRPCAEAAIRQVIEALDPNRVRLVLYTRRQDRLMESCYVSEIQKGKHHSFPRQFPNRYEPIFSYVSLTERLLGLPRVRGIRVRPYETIGAGVIPFVDDFLAAVDLRGKLDLSVIGDEVQQGSVYSRNALRLALAMNPHLDTVRERTLVREFLLSEFPSPPYTEARFISRKARERIIAAYRSDNERLFATHMPDLPKDSYGSIEATLLLEKAKESSPTHSPPRARRARRAVGRRLRRLARRSGLGHFRQRRAEES